VTVINYAKKTNNCSAARKFSVAEANVRRWQEQKQKLRNTKCIRKSFRGPKHGRFQELEKEVVEFVRMKRKIGVSITRERIKYKARELCKSHIMQHHFKASTGW
jgi:replicative superfamily II helicase